MKKGQAILCCIFSMTLLYVTYFLATGNPNPLFWIRHLPNFAETWSLYFLNMLCAIVIIVEPFLIVGTLNTLRELKEKDKRDRQRLNEMIENQRKFKKNRSFFE